MTYTRGVIAAVVGAASACYSGIDADDRPLPADDIADTEAHEPQPEGETPPDIATRSGLRRLTVFEYDNALRDLLRDDSRPAAELLPADALTPFDNDYRTQAPSEALVLAAEKLATDAVARLIDDADRYDALVGCSLEDDDECLRAFVARFGRRAFRRPLTPDEIDAYTSVRDVGIIVRAMLQDPSFLYRVEIGEPIAPGIMQLDDFEVATRLSFFLWSTIPDDDLLDAAEAGRLSSAADVRERAEAMLADRRARAAVDRFHALWLGYARLDDEGLARDMRRESDALVEDVVLDSDAPWLSILTRERTYLTPSLADHYVMPISEDGWVDYAGNGRGGILSHGSVLALGAKFDDTSPTTRGLELRERLFCQTIEVPPDLDVNVDDPPGPDPDACKWDRYAAHREVGTCSGCHALLDGIGFGLENYDATGAFRSHDVGKPECEIAGEGELPDVGSFNGPAELGALLVGVSAVHECAARQLYRYVVGRSELDDVDDDFLATLEADRETRLRELMIEIASSDAFRFRATQEGA